MNAPVHTGAQSHPVQGRSRCWQPRCRGAALDALRAIDARAKVAFLVAFMLAALHASTLPSMAACVALALVLALFTCLDARTVRAVLLPLVPILVFTAVLQVASLREGDAAFLLGGFAVTWPALAASAWMVARLFALVLASIAFMRCTAVEDLLSVLHWMLAPLRKHGMRADAFALALTVAMGFAPVLVGEFGWLRTAQRARLADFDGPFRQRVRAYARLFAPLLRSSFEHADRVAESVLARGFSCAPAPTRLRPGHFGAREGVCLAAAAALVAIACV